MQQLITNDSFAQRPVGTSSFQSVRMDLRWTQFFRFRPVAGKTVQDDPGCLDLERFLRRDDVDVDVDQVDEQAVHRRRRPPRSFGSLHAFQADRSLCYISQEMPIAVIGFRNAAEKKALADKSDRRARSKSCGYSFLGGVTFNKLLQAYRCMDPNDMCMGAVVLENTPAHLYFDFDAGLSTREDRQLGAAQALAIKVQGREQQVKHEFVASFATFFQQVYHRAPNWIGLHWETASDLASGKFSLHAHLITEAFVDVRHMHRFMCAYLEYVSDQWRDGNIEWLQHNQGEDVANLLDGSVYTSNRVFRLVGNRKPCKTPLRPCPSTVDEAQLSWQELVFRGMPSLAIDVAEEALLTFAGEATTSGRKRARPPPATLLNCEPTRKKLKRHTATVTAPHALAVLEQIFAHASVLGPQPRISACRTVVSEATGATQQRTRFEGTFELGSAWCPTRTRANNATPYTHEHTLVSFCVTARCVSVYDFCCGTDVKYKFEPDLVQARVAPSEWSAMFFTASAVVVAPQKQQAPVMIESLDEFASLSASLESELTDAVVSPPNESQRVPLMIHSLEESGSSSSWSSLPSSPGSTDSLMPTTPSRDADVDGHAPQAKTYYDEKHILLQRAPTKDQVRAWMLGCLAYIEDTESWLVRMRATGWQPLPKAGKHNFPFATHSSGSSITYMTSQGETARCKFSDILLELKDAAVFNTCRYSTAQFLPYFKVLPPAKADARIFNTFNGWMYEFGGSDEVPMTADDPDVKRVNDHLWDLCGRDAPVFAYLLQWLACILQYPQRKLCVLVFYSMAEGVGKNMLQDFLQIHVFGPMYVKALQTTRSILGNFNTATEGRLLTIINECKEDGRSILDNEQFKSLITDTNCDVNGKFQAEREIQNYNKYIMLTNNKHSCQIGKGRRFLMMQCSDEHAMQAPAVVAAYFTQLSGQILNARTGRKYFQYLAQMDLSQFVPTNIPNTVLKTDLKRDQMPSALKHVVSLVEEQRLPHILKANWTDEIVPVKILYGDYREWCRDEGTQPQFVLKQSRYKEQLTGQLKLAYRQFVDAHNQRVCGIRFERGTLASAIGKAIMNQEFAFATVDE